MTPLQWLPKSPQQIRERSWPTWSCLGTALGPFCCHLRASFGHLGHPWIHRAHRIMLKPCWPTLGHLSVICKREQFACSPPLLVVSPPSVQHSLALRNIATCIFFQNLTDEFPWALEPQGALDACKRHTRDTQRPTYHRSWRRMRPRSFGPAPGRKRPRHRGLHFGVSISERGSARPPGLRWRCKRRRTTGGAAHYG